MRASAHTCFAQTPTLLVAIRDPLPSHLMLPLLWCPCLSMSAPAGNASLAAVLPASGTAHHCICMRCGVLSHMTDRLSVCSRQEVALFIPQLRHGAAAARGNRASMEDCHVGADSFLLPTAALGAAPVAVPDIRAFYAVSWRTCGCMTACLPMPCCGGRHIMLLSVLLPCCGSSSPAFRSCDVSPAVPSCCRCSSGCALQRL
jgi:hypothetical protein